MENSSNKRKFSPTVWHPAARWAFVLGLCAVAGVIVSYYWRVFYGLDARGVPPLQITGLCVVLAMAAGAAALLLRHCKDFAKRGACCILLCGALFAFANPGTACILLCGMLFVFANTPMQTPDETDHYLRTYAISMGRFDFDAKRSYPEDVNELMDAFPGAWVNAHTSAGLGTDPDTNAEQPYNTAGYALKQYGKDGRVESICIGGVTVEGTQVRSLFGLRSACFTAEAAADRVTFRVTGFGHGVGMSQYGANRLAQEGKSWQEILHWYYTGVTIAPYGG